MTLLKKTIFITFLIFALLGRSEVTYANAEFDPKILEQIQLHHSSFPSDVIITKITIDGPAYTAGMKINDKIVSIDEKKIKSALNAVEFILYSKSEIMEIIVLRNNQEVKLKVKPVLEWLYPSWEERRKKYGKVKRIGVNFSSACSDLSELEKNNKEKYNECWYDYYLRELNYFNKLTKSSPYHDEYIRRKIRRLIELGRRELQNKNISKSIEFYESAYNLAIENESILESFKITNPAWGESVRGTVDKWRIAYSLGDIYLNVSVPKDYNKAMEYLTIASEDLYKAWIDLGLVYLEGRGAKLDEKKAFELINKSSTHGSGFEHVYLGDFYLLGLGSQKKNYSKALRHFKLAELGSRGTINFSNIEVLYKYKRLPEDADEFYSWLLENIEKNSRSIPSIERLGYLSNTILKNYSEAYKWYYICSKIEFDEEESYFGQAYMRVPEIKERCFNKLDILETEYLSNYEADQAKIAADEWKSKYMN